MLQQGTATKESGINLVEKVNRSYIHMLKNGVFYAVWNCIKQETCSTETIICVFYIDAIDGYIIISLSLIQHWIAWHYIRVDQYILNWRYAIFYVLYIHRFGLDSILPYPLDNPHRVGYRHICSLGRVLSFRRVLGGRDLKLKEIIENQCFF